MSTESEIKLSFIIFELYYLTLKFARNYNDINKYYYIIFVVLYRNNLIIISLIITLYLFPCEVKSINDKMISDVKDDKIILSQKGEQFGEIGLIQELITQIIRNKWKDHLIYAIERQYAKIILFHTDSSLIMNDLNAWCRSFEPDEICFSYSNILDMTLDFLHSNNKKFIPLIICSSIASIKFDQRYVLVKIPIIRNSVKENKLDHNRFNESNIEILFSNNETIQNSKSL